MMSLALPHHESGVYRCLPNPNTVGDVCIVWESFFEVVNVEETYQDLTPQEMYEDYLEKLPYDICCAIEGLERPEKDKYVLVKSSTAITDFFVLLESEPIYHTICGEYARLCIVLKEDDYFSFSFVISAAFVNTDGEFVKKIDMTPQSLRDAKDILKSYFDVL